MGLKDRISGYVPESLRTPLKPVSYDGFLETLQEQQARRVTANPNRRVLVRKRDPETGASATGWQYYVAFEGVGRQGRRISYDLPCADRVSQDVDSRNHFGGKMLGENLVLSLEEAWLMTTYVTADTLLTGIREQMPQCETVLMDGGKPFTPDEYDDLRARAREGHIRPWSE